MKSHPATLCHVAHRSRLFGAVRPVARTLAWESVISVEPESCQVIRSPAPSIALMTGDRVSQYTHRCIGGDWLPAWVRAFGGVSVPSPTTVTRPNEMMLLPID